MSFDPKEHLVSGWLEANARVTWLEHPEPWTLETKLIKALSLPLNLDQNATQVFALQDWLKDGKRSGC